MKNISARFSNLRTLGIVLLILVFSIGTLKPAGAQAILDIPISNETEREAVFVPLRLIAPDCNYGGLIKSVEAVDRYSVVFNLCRSDAAFLTRIATPSFAIYPQEWIEATTGYSTRTTEGLEHPIGTGPYMVGSWSRGDNITFVKNPDYWGTAPLTDTLIFRWSDQPNERLLALQSGAIDGFDDVSPADYATIEADPNLQLVVRDGLNTFYIGMNNTFTPFNDVKVRQAIAMGIDRQQIIGAFYPPGSEMATHFTPCNIPNGCVGADWYDFDAATAQALLTDAGYADGFQTHLYYRNVPRVYLPDRQRSPRKSTTNCLPT
jgi:ABC-type transport system substrate-binding protein